MLDPVCKPCQTSCFKAVHQSFAWEAPGTETHCITVTGRPDFPIQCKEFPGKVADMRYFWDEGALSIKRPIRGSNSCLIFWDVVKSITFFLFVLTEMFCLLTFSLTSLSSLTKIVPILKLFFSYFTCYFILI